jgi:CBS domain-containing protein
MKTTTVREVMTAPVVAVRRHARYAEIADTLRRHGVSAVPVIDARTRVLGVVSEADLLPKVEFPADGGTGPLVPEHRRQRRARAKAVLDTAAELMTHPAVTVSPDASITHAARLMDDHRVKRLPVIDSEGRLVGVVSRCDLLRGTHASDLMETPPAVEATGPVTGPAHPARGADDWGW